MPDPCKVLWFDRDEDEPERSFFGLEIVRGTLIRESDIATFPFYTFWRDSSKGSTVLADFKTGERFVPLQDWRAFAQLFIETGRHRWM